MLTATHNAYREKGSMRSKLAMFFFELIVLVFPFVIALPVRAQVAGATLTGTITDTTGAITPSAKVSVTNIATGQAIETQTDSSGVYRVSNLTPGDYELAVTAPGHSTNTIKVTIIADVNNTADLRLGQVLLLGDLGFSPSQTQGSAQDQARLDRRSHMLKIHQRLGLIDTAPLIATVILGAGAAGKGTSSTDRWVHLALGSATGDLYFMSAYYAIRAPKIQGTQTRGQIRVHKALAWIHGPGMILTPILGAIAFDQKKQR